MNTINEINNILDKWNKISESESEKIETYLQNNFSYGNTTSFQSFLGLLAKVPVENLSVLSDFLDSLIIEIPSIQYSDRNYIEAKNWLCNYFKNNIETYLITDLIVLQNIPEKLSESIEVWDKIKHDELGYCTIPQAMAIFSYMDILGFLLRIDTNAEDLSSKKDTGENIKYFLKQFYINKSFISENDIKPLINLYRHGMMHQFLPKNVHVYKNPVRNTQPPFKVMQHKEEINNGTNRRRYVLNVSDFTECFLIALSDLRKDFDSEDDNIKKRNFNMYLKWKKLCESDEEEAIKQFPSRQNRIEPIVTTTIQFPK